MTSFSEVYNSIPGLRSDKVSAVMTSDDENVDVLRRPGFYESFIWKFMVGKMSSLIV